MMDPKLAAPMQFLLLNLVVFVAASGFSRAAEAARAYEIELLVFKNLVENDGGEVWPIDYSEWFEQPLEGGPETLTESPAVTWLDPAQYRLAAHQNALAKSGQYRPVAYIAWRQTVQDRRQARALQLPDRKAGGGKTYVDGSVRVAVERYLHLYLDLQLHTQLAGETPELPEFGIPEFRLREHRRMRSREVHYFDHPRFGVIALITPYEAPAEPEPEPAPAPAQKAVQPAAAP